MTLPPPALGVLLASVDPAKSAVLPVLPVLGISPGAFSCFMLFWLVNMAVDGQGIDCIRWIEALRACCSPRDSGSSRGRGWPATASGPC
ncbi:MAG: hypothetical protein KJ066_20855 [Acidobacteria bacterium]|nr:hypothetical protein [Acidobacteriota bacterium]